MPASSGSGGNRDCSSPSAGWKVGKDGQEHVRQDGLEQKGAFKNSKPVLSECSFYAGGLQNHSGDLLKVSEESYGSEILGRFNDVHERNSVAELKQRRGRIWGPEWGLAPWPGMGSICESKSDNRSNGNCSKRKLSPGKWNSNSRKPFDFHHSSDFREYIRRYREGHSQVVLLKDRQSSSTRQSERISVTSSVAEGTDLSTLVTKVEQHTQKPPKPADSTGGSEPAEKCSPALVTEIGKTNDIEGASEEVRPTYGCSKGMAVFRRGVNLSPTRPTRSPEHTFDIAAAMDLARQEESRRHSPQSKYLNLKSYKSDKHIHNQVQILQPQKKGKCIENSDRNYFHLYRTSISQRASLSQMKSVQVVGLPTTWKSSIHTNPPLTEKSNTTNPPISREDLKMVTSSGIRLPASAQRDKPESLYLGYCLSQLSTRKKSIPDKEEQKLAEYQLQGRQLRGDIFSPRSAGGRCTSHDVTETEQSAPIPFISDIPVKINLGIKGSTLQSQLNQTARQTACLGIFDMPV